MHYSSVEKCKLAMRKYPLTPLEKIHGKIPQLKIGDIVLVRMKEGGWTRAILRKLTNSYWDHTALVVFPRDSSRGHFHDIIMESFQTARKTTFIPGATMHLLDKYLMKPEKYDVGICRFGWLSTKIQKRIRSFALMNVDTPYYPIRFPPFFLALINKRYRKRFMQRQRYSCSGFVQKAFYEAVDRKDRRKVIFRKGYSPIQVQDIVSPGDIPKNSYITWVWNKH